MIQLNFQYGRAATRCFHTTTKLWSRGGEQITAWNRPDRLPSTVLYVGVAQRLIVSGGFRCVHQIKA